MWVTIPMATRVFLRSENERGGGFLRRPTARRPQYASTRLFVSWRSASFIINLAASSPRRTPGACKE